MLLVRQVLDRLGMLTVAVMMCNLIWFLLFVIALCLLLMPLAGHI